MQSLLFKASVSLCGPGLASTEQPISYSSQCFVRGRYEHQVFGAQRREKPVLPEEDVGGEGRKERPQADKRKKGVQGRTISLSKGVEQD